MMFRFLLAIGLGFGAVAHPAPLVAQGSVDPYERVEQAEREGTFQSRIFNGHPAKLGEDPWQVALVKADTIDNYRGHFCGGVWIGQRTVLTAAHCIAQARTKEQIEILAGIVDLDAKTPRIKVKKIWRNDAYVPSNDGPALNDILILELYADLDLKPVSLATPQVESNIAKIGSMARVTGWGFTNQWDKKSSLLQWANVPLVRTKTCNEVYSGKIKVGMLCAGNGSPDSCEGDSGGPLTLSDAGGGRWLLGLVIWGEHCGTADRAGVYTHVANQAIQSWISETQSKFLTNEDPGAPR
jgi:secreted trypsin-like serine protease